MAKDTYAKKLFRIGEVSQRTGINPHILRYWESEFQILAPNRRLSKQRLYRQTDIDLILTIKRLLEEEKYTLPGVKQYLAEHRAGREKADPVGVPATQTVVQMIRKELQDILEVLDGKKSGT